MSDFRYVTPDFAVAGQLQPADLAAAAAAGFKLVINNRPDGEGGPGQMSDAQARAGAQAAGLAYRYLPFAGAALPTPEALAGLDESLGSGPVLAFCRTGTRSIRAWAMAEARSGRRKPDEIIALAQKAGYDLSGARGALEDLAGG